MTTAGADEIQVAIRDMKEFPAIDGDGEENQGHGPRYSHTETPAELYSAKKSDVHPAIHMMKSLPAHVLGISFTRNSFFARRLFLSGLLVLTIDIVALVYYYLSFGTKFGLAVAYTDENQTIVNLDDYADKCDYWIMFANDAYWCGPAIFVLMLPATGIRFFELFSRKKPSDLGDKKFKVKRTLYLQFCEVVSVLLLVYMLILTIMCIVFIIESQFKCYDVRTIFYSLVSLVVFFSQLGFLAHFTRFREHIKMQLGAFRESNQTGDVRSHLGRKKSEAQRIRKMLYKAVEHSNNEELDELLAEATAALGPAFATTMYPSATLSFGYFAVSQKNPVHVAASMGNIPALRSLFAAGFDVNALDKVSRIRFSTSDLFWFFIRHVVEQPISSSDQDRNKRLTLLTPLHCAVATSQIDTVRFLVEDMKAKVEILAVSPYAADRVPPLFMVEHPKIVEILLLAGANHLMIPEPGTVNCITALEIAYLRENYAVCSVLEDWGSDVALTPMHRYAALGNAAKVQKYLKMKVDPNCLGEHGYIGVNIRTPLHWAAVNGQQLTVLVLLQGGADPNFQDARGRSPLHWAVRTNKPEVVRILLENGADADLQDAKGMTPVICAAFAEHVSPDLLRALVQHGANINFQLKSNGDTALHIAIKHEKQDTATALVRLHFVGCGASIMATNHAGFRAIDIATSTALQFAIKSAAGHRDVMISYTHSHAEFALKLRRSLEAVNITAWLDTMDPSGIGGGSVWREEIAKGISNASLLVAIISEDYTKSEWCLKELATAKQVGTPVLPISTEHVRLNEELQVYLYTRQIVPFEPAITSINNANPRNVTYTYNDDKYQVQFRLLLDGIRDEIEKRRKKAVLLRTQGSMMMSPTSSTNSTFFLSPKSSPANAMLEKKFVFLAHGDCHRSFAKRLYGEITKNKQVECYLDLKTTKEMSLRVHAAKDAILRCSAVVVILSAKSVKSELLNDQLAFAEDKGKAIFPVLLHTDFTLPPNQLYSLSRTTMFHFALEMGFASSFDYLMTSLKANIGLNAIEEGDEEGNGRASLVAGGLI
ncbi:Aste57867_22423 [Aphanomyces stellatus]|uniref:Aste57867_22423 protein n=1 Tax=Aphanomyces stellatus TaxID=120398 RepID=A0A485LK81_9STRA|nr:hypothetical protein As57867_022353 [Aphanomyces stellatus]VFT99085.1 Aste57867_22423 [Aphanomyces stellatus]